MLLGKRKLLESVPHLKQHLTSSYAVVQKYASWAIEYIQTVEPNIVQDQNKLIATSNQVEPTVPPTLIESVPVRTKMITFSAFFGHVKILLNATEQPPNMFFGCGSDSGLKIHLIIFLV